MPLPSAGTESLRHPLPGILGGLCPLPTPAPSPCYMLSFPSHFSTHYTRFPRSPPKHTARLHACLRLCLGNLTVISWRPLVPGQAELNFPF